MLNYLGVYEGISLAWDLGLKNIIVETDSLCVVQLLQKKPDYTNNHTTLINAIKLLLQRDYVVQINHIPREANNTGDFMASNAHNVLLGCNRVTEVMNGLFYWLDYDMKGVAYPCLIKLQLFKLLPPSLFQKNKINVRPN